MLTTTAPAPDRDAAPSAPVAGRGTPARSGDLAGAVSEVRTPTVLAAAAARRAALQGNSPALLTVRDILGAPMPHKAGRPLARGVIRGLLLAFGGCIVRVRGLERIATEHDPFILALNHSTKLEALFLPAFLLHARGGKALHFIADWNLKLVPGIACIYRAGDVITLDRKPARPRFLNALRPLLTDRVPAFTRAAERLAAGASVGIFPEGTTNRDPRRLLRGFHGAAKLSLQAGVPVVPAGVRFPRHEQASRIPELAPMEIEFGAPLVPPAERDLTAAAVRAWHACVMSEIARLSGKTWSNERKTHD
ncbi:MAG: 1-acyl-sn-glycerol-3-phosphate acyltransferase [Limisphaerales bacterium]|nr:MAG: 1-acyl-sn-glycerol-3-phosphate acyltransferase [Limisphaerales bacterium]KAG0507414.1 MAG: 1-acyl-sn-glycerol-3-phosphate acyltransferase [Limisphaerales bacterium]TXT51364.1 MAG: 1-acyl-sn-glycerol-3-phosphate acyltransferase [Limisphaerales bacterium]